MDLSSYNLDNIFYGISNSFDSVLLDLSSAFVLDILWVFLILIAFSFAYLNEYVRENISYNSFSSIIIGIYVFLRFAYSGSLVFYACIIVYLAYAVVSAFCEKMGKHHLKFLCNIDEDMAKQGLAPPVPFNQNSREILQTHLKATDPPTFLYIAKIVSTSFFFLLRSVPMIYAVNALTQFDTAPPVSWTVIVGAVIMIYATYSLFTSTLSLKKQEELSFTAAHGRYMTHGTFKRTQSPLFYFQWLFWLGLVIGCSSYIIGIPQWFVVFCGFLLSSRQLLQAAGMEERIRYHRYFANTGYKQYRHATPVFFPFLPYYSISKPDVEFPIDEDGNIKESNTGKKEKSPKKDKKSSKNKGEEKSEKTKKKKEKKPKKEEKGE